MSWFDSAALKLTLPVFHASPCGLLTRHAAVVRDKGSAPWGRDGSHTAPFCHDGEEVPSLFLSLCQPSRVEGDSWGTPVLSLFSLPVLSCFIPRWEHYPQQRMAGVLNKQTCSIPRGPSRWDDACDVCYTSSHWFFMLCWHSGKYWVLVIGQCINEELILMWLKRHFEGIEGQILWLDYKISTLAFVFRPVVQTCADSALHKSVCTAGTAGAVLDSSSQLSWFET